MLFTSLYEGKKKGKNTTDLEDIFIHLIIVICLNNYWSRSTTISKPEDFSNSLIPFPTLSQVPKQIYCEQKQRGKNIYFKKYIYYGQ